ncbi:MAG: Vitamin B12 dependent methionine synthase activation subunit [Clostridia bacterium]|nr:Vitamin B12 dependent methionine synthase activation subunit [Clostridia bacterium]
MRNAVLVRSYGATPYDYSEIFRYAGVRSADGDMNELLEQCLLECEDCFSYNVCYTTLPVNLGGGLVEFGGLKVGSKNLSAALNGCESVVVFAATVGLGIDRLIKKYSRISPSKALMFQAIGTERAESLCESFCKDLREELDEKGFETRPRFSAGYGDFPLSCQRDIFAMLDGCRRIGLCLNESLLMSPSKSVTAVVGIKRKG